MIALDANVIVRYLLRDDATIPRKPELPMTSCSAMIA